VRDFLRPDPRPARRLGAFSTSSVTSGCTLPTAATIGYLLGIPEQGPGGDPPVRLDEGLRTSADGEGRAAGKKPTSPGRCSPSTSTGAPSTRRTTS